MSFLPRTLALLLVLAAMAEAAHAQGLLVPTDRRFQPCTITFQRVSAVIRDQAAETRVEQEFRNDTSTPLEAHYMFPIPDKAAVKDFAMTVDGKRVKGEVVEAPKARQVYEDIVRRTKDPGLLEHMGKNLWRVRVFPVPARGKQKFELTYTEVVSKDAGITSYTYPLKAAGPTARVDGFFAVRLELHSAAALKSVYSPTHSVGVSREGDHKAIVGFEENNAHLNRDFQVFWTTDDRDVGLSLIAHRESGGEAGYFMVLVSPKVETAGEKVPRDVVFVLDTSGSMREDKMAQARKALEFCIKALDPADRFGVLAFATTVNHYARDLKKAEKGNVESAVEWVRKLEAGGGTAIGDALTDALKMRASDARNFTVVFLTDGQPTIGETDPQAILKTASSAVGEGTRIFTFGVGDDVNTHLLDQLADQTRAVSTYVRPKEDLEVKVSSFFDKIRRPVLTNLALDIDGGDKRFSDVYPPKLPDLFHGGQLVVMGRYTGSGEGTIKLKGKVGDKEKEFTYKVSLPERRTEAEFLPSLWARRKIGYLLDQIRLKGETAELRDEVVFLAKRHGIATPYTSYLVVPDGQGQMGRGPIAAAPPASRLGMGFGMMGGSAAPGGPVGHPEAAATRSLSTGAGQTGGGLGGGVGGYGGRGVGDTAELRDERAAVTAGGAPAAGGATAPAPSTRGRMAGEPRDYKKSSAGRPQDWSMGTPGLEAGKPANPGLPARESDFGVDEAMRQAAERNDAARGGKVEALAQGGQSRSGAYGRQVEAKEAPVFGGVPEAGEKAVNLSVAIARLKESQNPDAVQTVKGKGNSQFLAVGKVWVDKAYRDGMKVVRVKYLSDAYFDVVAKVPGAKDVLSLGPQVVWKTPSGVALVVDFSGAERLSDGEWKMLLTPAPMPGPQENGK